MYLFGSDAQAAADYIFSAKTDSKIDKTVYTTILNANGGIEADCTITWIKPTSSSEINLNSQEKALYIGKKHLRFWKKPQFF